jgi:hypothetical protein
MRIERIVVEMRRLAAEIGGNHHTPEEAEKLLYKLSDELCETNVNMSIKLNQVIAEVDAEYTGVSEVYRYLYLRQKSIDELSKKKDNINLPSDHGRLIDADKLLEAIEKKSKIPAIQKNADIVNGLCGAVSLIYEAPTVIE